MGELSKKLFDDLKNIFKTIGRFFKDLFFFTVNFFKNYPLYLNVLMTFMIILSLFGVVLLNTPGDSSLYSFYAIFVDISILIGIMVLIDLIPNARAKHIVGYIMPLFFCCVMVADFGYYDAFGTFGSIRDLSSISWIFGDDVGLRLIWTQQILIIIFIIYTVIYMKFFVVSCNYIENRENITKYKSALLSLTIMCLTPFTTRLYFLDEDFDVDDEFYYIEYLGSDSYLYENITSRIAFAKKYGYVTYRIKDVVSLWDKIDLTETVEMLDTYFNETEEPEGNDYTGIFSDKNLVTIRLESFDTRLIDPVLTPNLYNIYTNSTTFSNYYLPEYQTGASCNTEFIMHTGIFPPLVGSYDASVCTSFPQTYYEYALPNQFTNAGYETYYIHQGAAEFYNRTSILPNSYGFNPENLFFSKTDLANNSSSPYDTDMATFFEYVDWNEQFFLDIMTYSAHAGSNEYFIDTDTGVGLTASQGQSDRLWSAPVDYSLNYTTNPGLFYDGKNSIQTYNTYLASFLAKMYETDLFIGMLLDAVDDAGQLDNTVFVFTPDHWPYMFETNGTYFTESGPEIYLQTIANPDYDLQNNGKVATHINDVMNQTFMIYDPSSTLATGNHEEVVSSIDIYKTILNLFDDGSGTFTHKYGFGDDMFQLVTEERDSLPIFADLSTYYNGEYIDFMSGFDYSQTIVGYDELVKLYNGKVEEVSLSLGIVVTNYFRDYYEKKA